MSTARGDAETPAASGLRLCFLGGGNMASALIGGLVARGFAPGDIAVVEVIEAGRVRLREQFNVHASAAPDGALLACDVLVLAVKPQDLRAAVAPLCDTLRAQLVISVAAGVRMVDLARWLGGYRRLVRCMPNTPALIGRGITGMYALPEVSGAERSRAEQILSAVGEVVWLPDEALLDPVTAVSASGPAYVFWMIEQLEISGIRMGLPAAAARRLALATVAGAAELALRSDEPPATLRARVTSKRGTTEAALDVFAREQLAERFARALEAASRRGTELGAELGSDPD